MVFVLLPLEFHLVIRSSSKMMEQNGMNGPTFAAFILAHAEFIHLILFFLLLLLLSMNPFNLQMIFA